MRRIAAALLAPILGAALPGAARAEEVIRIAYIDPLSGSLAATGQLGEQHFRFAIDRVNAAQAAGPGRRLELVPMDNEVSPEKSLTLLRKAVDDGIHYVTQGNGSSVAFALSDAVSQEQPPGAEPGRDVPELRRRGPRPDQRQVQLVALPLRRRRGHEDAGADRLPGRPGRGEEGLHLQPRLQLRPVCGKGGAGDACQPPAGPAGGRRGARAAGQGEGLSRPTCRSSRPRAPMLS